MDAPPDKKAGQGQGQGRAKATAELFGDLRKMVNNPELSDVLFRCQDGVQVCASRLLIMARSPALRTIVSVKKTREAQISLPEVSASSLLSVLEFLYTATLVEHAPRSSAQAYQIIAAARHFQLPRLEETVTEFLVNSTGDIAGDAAKAALRLSVALEFGPRADSAAAEGVPLPSLVRTLQSAELQPAQLRCLSETAFRYFLQRTQSGGGGGTGLWFGEYLRFRLVLLWCAAQVAPDEAAEVVNASVLDRRAAQTLARSPPRRSGSRLHPQIASREARYLRSLLADRPDAAARVESLLAAVDFRRIHAELLDEVVEPLKIVPEAQLMEAFRFQALRIGASRAPPPAAQAFHWEHGSSYHTGRDDAVLAKRDPEVGFAMFSTAIAAPYVVYEWDVVVEELCVEFCEIGFYVVAGEARMPKLTGATLAEQPMGWVLSHHFESGTRINHRKGDHLSFVPFKKDFAHANARVTVRLDLWERCCFFSVDRDEFLVAWVNLPVGTFYPAVSLGNGETGRVRIELVSGFDML